jgi:hypothetical protein
MGTHLNDIPGYREALAEAEQREESFRDLALLGLNVTVCGVDCKQFTPRHFIILNAARSPFLCGGDITPEDIAAFLWVISSCFDPDCRDSRDLFVAFIAGELEFESAITEIEQYLDNALIDRPASTSRGHRSPPVSFAASLIHRIASAYGWSPESILDRPLAELYQYLKCIRLDANPNEPNMSPFVTKLNAKFLREYLEKTNG